MRGSFSVFFFYFVWRVGWGLMVKDSVRITRLFNWGCGEDQFIDVHFNRIS